MSSRCGISSKVFALLGSAKLALVIIAMLIVLSLAGILLPQEGRVDVSQLHLWKIENPTISKIATPIGLFHVFQSWGFLVIIFLLCINTLTCTLKRLFGTGRVPITNKEQRVRMIGFTVLHIGILAILVGALVSAGTRFTGRVVLTEGQTFRNQDNEYRSMAKGPFSKKPESFFGAGLIKVNVESEDGTNPRGITANMEFASAVEGKVETAAVKFNVPAEFESLNFTLTKIGFSPRLRIQKEDNMQVSVNSFIAVNTFKTEQGRLYRDFLQLPFFENTVYITVLPSHIYKDGEAVKVSEKPENPLIIIEMEDASGNVIESKDLPFGKSVSMQGYTFAFEDLRRWAGFLVSADPGYPVIWWASWLSLAALLIRYAPDISSWFGEEKDTIETNLID